ncbi:PAS domain S-box-containing protein/diguanylate cyclase (GGDEF)-like protein [Pseudomonas duriflava]|uniref:PAS domain S-box-containing protein/diguanylate cyclase (GGDEF)-like protein n=1 Tax=Pseudomonas duriflava TaxID=459528 RepID=A0A562QMW0_9PSED|nr:diguanylate cyclase [Pseudomonas duriflava]TWI57396.1 PAS domain S-box-containing protein/diguanylate cyclase (GGDEF)-like protein [Pseudomonas duriflava]
MLPAPLPVNEQARLRLLHSLEILDTPAAETFDRITRVVAEMLKVPIALVSLVDEHRQWFKSKVGLDIVETPRNLSFCAYALHEEDMLVIEDAKADQRFTDNPLVTGTPHIRFYAGVPLRMSGGLVLGTLCAIDKTPRSLTPSARAALKDLARIIERELIQQETIKDTRIVHEYDRRALAVSEARFATAFHKTPTGKAIIDLKGHFIEVNPRLCEMLGYAPEVLQQKTLSDITHSEDLSLSLQLVDELLAGTRDTYMLEKRYLCQDGTFIWAELSVALVRDENAEPLHLLSVIQDVSDRKQSEALLHDHQMELERRVVQRTADLQSSRETLQAITDNLPLLIAHVDRTLYYQFANDIYRQIFGIDPVSLVGKPLSSMLHPELYEELLPCFQAVLAGERVIRDNIRYSLQQDRIWCTTYIPDIRQGEVVGFYVMSQDVTERKLAEKVLIDKAMLDPLTGLPNRRALGEKLEQIIHAAQTEQIPSAIFFMDLDGFKAINDMHGHDAGDEILRQVSRRLTQTVRRDDFVSRLAGDEFVIVASGIPSPGIGSRIAESICQALAVPFPLDNGFAKLGASIGITLCPTTGEVSAENLLAQADAAMYEAKRKGRNNHRFASPLVHPAKRASAAKHPV